MTNEEIAKEAADQLVVAWVDSFVHATGNKPSGIEHKTLIANLRKSLTEYILQAIEASQVDVHGLVDALKCIALGTWEHLPGRTWASSGMQYAEDALSAHPSPSLPADVVEVLGECRQYGRFCLQNKIDCLLKKYTPDTPEE